MINKFKWIQNNTLALKNKKILSLTKISQDKWKIRWPDGYLSNDEYGYFEGQDKIKQLINEMYPDDKNIILN